MQSHVAETIGTLVIQEEAVQIGAQPNALLAILEDGQHGIGRQLGRGVMTVDLAVGVQPVDAIAVGAYPHPVPAVFKNTQHALGTDIQLGVEKAETPVVKNALLLGYHHDTFLIQPEPQVALLVLQDPVNLGMVHVNMSQVGVVGTDCPFGVIVGFKAVTVGSYPNRVPVPLFQGEGALDRRYVVAYEFLGVIIEQIDAAVNHANEHIAVGQLDKRKDLVARQGVDIVGVVGIIDNGVILHVQHTDTVVLRANPDVAETVFIQSIDFVGTDVAVGRQIIDRTVVIAFQANGSGPTGREPYISPAVLDDATDITEIGHIGIGEVNGRKTAGSPVEQLQAAGSTHPKVSLGIVVDRQHRVVVERSGIIQDVVVGLESHSVEAVQAVVGTNPYQSAPVLIDTVDVTVGKPLLQPVELVGIGNHRQYRQPQQHPHKQSPFELYPVKHILFPIYLYSHYKSNAFSTNTKKLHIFNSSLHFYKCPS